MNRADMVRKARGHICQTQEDTARALGFNLSSWQRKENGIAPVRSCELIAMAAMVNGIRTVEDAQRIIELATSPRGGK